jgi:hypothetical protein
LRKRSVHSVRSYSPHYRKLVFNRLSYDVQLEIAGKILESELSFLAEKGLAISCGPAVLQFLVQRVFTPAWVPARCATPWKSTSAMRSVWPASAEAWSLRADLGWHEAALCLRTRSAE